MKEENQQKAEKIFSISDYIKIVNQGLKTFRSKIIGEVSEVSFGPTGHVYFTLKDEGEEDKSSSSSFANARLGDEAKASSSSTLRSARVKDESVINCVMWKFKYDIYGIELKEGLKIIATGYPEIYAPWGRLSFKSEVIEYAGEGTLKKEYEKLKEKLIKQGLFEEFRKRPIPKYPQRIGIITSRHGAVLADFLNNLARFGFKIKMIDSRVEGQAAIADLLLSIKTLKKENIEVLVIMRGGGSLESMSAFNNELLVREITGFSVPIIAAIGHHKDVPLAALAADRSVSTPSIAATLLSESWDQAASLLREHEKSVVGSYEDILGNANSLISQSWKKSTFGFISLLSKNRQELEHSEKIIYLRNPETQLRFGYSIARCENRLIRTIRDVKIGKEVSIYIVDGTIISKVKNIIKKHG